MATQRAIKIQRKGVAAVVDDALIPQLRPDDVLVETYCIGLNPTDWKTTQFFPSVGSTVGCDFAGIVRAVGEAVTDLQVGDRVRGTCHGSNSKCLSDGAFANYIAAAQVMTFKMPENMTMEEGASVGVAVATVGMCLYQSLGLRLLAAGHPRETKEPILIYGGSTSIGTLALQIAKLCGMTVITTCSPANFDLVRSYGADFAFDYNSPTVVADIKAAAGDNVKKIMDCVSTSETGQLCGAAMGPGPDGHYVCVNPVTGIGRTDVRRTLRYAYTGLGRPCRISGKEFPVIMEDVTTTRMFQLEIWELLFKKRALKLHPLCVRAGGLDAALKGLGEMRDGKVRGVKLIYEMKI
ncbi:putative zinc-binding oxidoreductase ToxD [Lophiotrema nucula]|uniref:Putative zinc-binding oxidoreductase ToxD n=1 Tax=Lophiotrema nucula TaxID=690887 RepID=A0A6A5YJU3_9PLEO|nr:putative zinc-binding oxidoreductase ToxD [Lophiotrema nucula]